MTSYTHTGRLHMKKLLLVLVVLLAVPATAGAYSRPRENPYAFLRTSQVRHDANGLASRLARRNDAKAFNVGRCRHMRKSAVLCEVTLYYVDDDGYSGTEAWTVTGIATYGGRWAEIRPVVPYATGYVPAR